jgi:hypothetical protein
MCDICISLEFQAHRFVIVYQCFSTNSHSHLQGQAVQVDFFTTDDGTDNLSPKLVTNANLSYVKFQKSANLIHTLAEVWNHNVNICIYKGPPLGPMLCWLIPDLTCLSYFFQPHLNIILSCMSISTKVSLFFKSSKQHF